MHALKLDTFFPRRAGHGPTAATYDPGHFLLTMLWNADPALARRADEAGIDRIGLDLEVLGKAERQQGLGTWVSRHREDQLAAMRRAVSHGELFCRTNPIHAGSKAEIDRLISGGVNVLMLPMFTTVDEVKIFTDVIAGRAKAVPLVEHHLAAQQIERIVRVPGIDCIHVGLTDLALSLKVANRFALMTSNLLDRIAASVHGEGLRLCIGGIGRAMDASQPIPSDLIYSQYPRLGATGALISRAFFGKDPDSLDIKLEVAACRARMAHWRDCSDRELLQAGADFIEKVGASPTG